MKFTMEELLDGKVDARKVKVTDIVQFIDDNGIDMPIDLDRGIRDTLNDICDFLMARKIEAETVAEPVTVGAETELPDEAEHPKAEESKLPPYLQRRHEKIQYEINQTATGGPNGGSQSIPPGYYGETPIQDFLKRRIAK